MDQTVNLSPSQASIPAGNPVHLKAIEAEATRGTEMASFRIPGRMKTLVNRLVVDPRYGFQGQQTRFYLQAVASHLLTYRMLMTDDPHYQSVTAELSRVSTFMAVQDVVERFEDHLRHAEKLSEFWRSGEDLDRGLELLDTFVKTAVQDVSGTAGAACRRLIRASKPLYALLASVLRSDRHATDPRAGAIQAWWTQDD